MGKTQKILFALVSFGALGTLVAYFVSEPDLRKTEQNARRFHETAAPGVSLGDAIRASPDFKSVTFGPCGHLDSSPDSGPKGSLIFSPSQGAFARFTSFDEFISRNPRLISDHEECRDVSVMYMTIFPARMVVELRLDGRGLIVSAKAPVYLQ